MAMNVLIRYSAIILFLAVYYAFFNLKDATFYEKDLNSAQDELKPEVLTPVLDADGKLTMAGWGKSSENFSFDASRINPSTSFSFLRNFRYKKWEAFVIANEDFILGTAIFDVSYVGGYFVHYSEMKDNTEINAIEHVHPTKKPIIQDDCSRDCSAKYTLDDYLKYDQGTIGKSDFVFFKLNTSEIQLEIDLKYNKDLTENLVTLNPISKDSTLFYYNNKRYLIPANGKIVVNGKTHSGKFFITSDSGRGVWPLRSGWIWASATGKTKKGHNIALNLGHGFNHPEASRHTEDCFFIDGKLFKLEAATTEKKFKEDKSEEWVFNSNISDRIKNKCEIKFTPKKIKNDFMDTPLIKSFVKFDLRYGVYHGTCTDENGEVYEFYKINGILEDKLSLW
jgi:hypothetical protein